MGETAAETRVHRARCSLAPLSWPRMSADTTDSNHAISRPCSIISPARPERHPPKQSGYGIWNGQNGDDVRKSCLMY